MKVIFLDIDGVLNYEGAKTRTSFGTYFVEDDKLDLLKELVEKTGAELVLSSSWRRGWGTSNSKDRFDIDDSKDYFVFCAKLHDYGLNLLSEIPRLRGGNREDAIHYWLDEWIGEKIEEYIILDDEPGKFYEHNRHLIVTSKKSGLTQKEVDVAKRILNVLDARKKILVVDDVEVNRAVIVANLEMDYILFEAKNGKEALETLEKESIDLVITDIQMPEMNGLELIKEIRSQSKYNHIPIIANTQYGDMNQEEVILDAGATDFVYKPSTPKIMKVRVRNVLNG